LDAQPINRRKVLRAIIAVGLPLVIALIRHELLPAVYGAIAGFYTIFVDYGGSTYERIAAILYMTVGMLLAGIAGVVGHFVPGAPLLLLLGFATLAGWLQGAGTSVEFIGKYWLLAFLFGDGGGDLPPLCGTYVILGGLAGVLSVLIDRALWRTAEPQSAPMLADAATTSCLQKAPQRVAIWNSLLRATLIWRARRRIRVLPTVRPRSRFTPGACRMRSKPRASGTGWNRTTCRRCRCWPVCWRGAWGSSTNWNRSLPAFLRARPKARRGC